MMNNTIPNRLFSRNRSNFAAQLPPKSVAVFTANEAMPRNGDEFYPYRQQSDFFYLTGINEENSFLLIAPDYPDETMREVLFIDASKIKEIGLLAEWIKLIAVAWHGFVGSEYSH